MRDGVACREGAGAEGGAGAERWTVDALEDAADVRGGRVARLEGPGGESFTLPLSALPEGVREGDVLAVQVGADGVSARVVPQETARRRHAAQARLDRLNGEAADGKDGEAVDGGEEVAL